jgi:phosphatidylglycerophosphatase A
MNETPGRLDWRLWRDPEVVIVCGLGSGFVPKAPGTSGSLAAVLIWWLLLAEGPLALQVGAILGVTIIGTWLTGRVQARYQVKDPGAIVIDEFAGQWIALLFVPVTWWGLLAAFGLFRLFDIWKPWPVGALERGVKGAFGVMVDDLAAGLMALAVLQFTLLGFQNI